MTPFNELVARTVIAAALAAFSLAPAHADEGVQSIETKIVIAANGEARVHHHIAVDAEGGDIEHGIYFTIPHALGPVSGFHAMRDGAAEPYSVDDGEVKVGDPDKTLAHGPHVYEIDYRAASPFLLNRNSEAVFAWKPIVGDIDLSWRNARIEIDWPAGKEPLRTDAGEGAQTGNGALVWRSAGEQDAKPQAISLVWAQDVFPAASIRKQSINETLRYGAPLAVLAVFFIFQMMWRAAGKDPSPGAVSQTENPPRGFSAAACRYVKKMSYDTTCFIAAFAGLAAKGSVTVRFENRRKLEVARTDGGRGGLSADEQALETALFEEGNTVTLKSGGRAFIRAHKAHNASIKTDFGRYFSKNRGLWMRGFAFAGALAAAIFYLLIREAAVYDGDHIALIAAAISIPALLVIAIVYAPLMRAPTQEGRIALDGVDGLKLYLTDAEPLPANAGDKFVALLPFAIALDAEKKWAGRFGDQLPVAEDPQIQAIIDWYAEIRRQAHNATMVAAIMPVIVSSGSTGAGATGGGAAAGGW